MRILNISLDRTLLNEGSKTRERLLDYANLVDKYSVVVPLVGASENREMIVNDKLTILGVASRNKISALYDLYVFLAHLLKKEKVDVITVQDQYYVAYICLKLARKFKIGLEIQNHGFEKFSGLRKMIFKYVIKRADAVRTVSQRLKQRLIDEFGVKEERITVVPIHVEVRSKEKKDNLYSPPCSKEGLGEVEIFPSLFQGGVRGGQKFTPPGLPLSEGEELRNKFIFLTIGRLVPVKNIEMQIETMKRVSEECPNAELWIVGQGELQEELRLKIKDLRMEEKIKLLGWQKDVGKFYKQADVFMLTSHAEAWPLVIIEAASYGLPVIMTDTGSAREFIYNNENGIVIPINDKTALEEAMIKLYKDEELRRRLSENVIKSLEKLPGKEEILKLYLSSWNKARRL